MCAIECELSPVITGLRNGSGRSLGLTPQALRCRLLSQAENLSAFFHLQKLKLLRLHSRPNRVDRKLCLLSNLLGDCRIRLGIAFDQRQIVTLPCQS